MVVGCPGSGKSWVCEQLRDRFHYVPHDFYIDQGDSAYLLAIKHAVQHGDGRPLLIETPFSMSALEAPLNATGRVRIVPVFIQEPAGVIEERYMKREGKPIPLGHIARQRTYAARASERNAYAGTSAQVLEYLKHAVQERFPWE